MVCTIFTGVRMHPFALSTHRVPFPHSAPLFAHLESQNVEFMQFAFRWMNCLLMREISVQNTIRMWDTYLVSTFPVILTWAGRYNDLILCSSRKDQTLSRNFIFMFAPRSWFAGVNNYAKWIFRLDF